MSVIIRKLFCLVLFVFSFFCLSQETQKKEIIVYFGIKNKAINSFYVKKDSSEATFSIYAKGFETKKLRDQAVRKFKNKKEGDPDNRWIPDFTVSFISYSKPEKLKSIEKIKYLTMDEFRNNLFPQGYPMYFIYKSDNGNYLKWKVVHVEY